MGQNSADFIDQGKQLGTVQAGKLADLLVLGGNPLVGYWNFNDHRGGDQGRRRRLDKRGKPNAGKPMDKPQT